MILMTMKVMIMRKMMIFLTNMTLMRKNSPQLITSVVLSLLAQNLVQTCRSSQVIVMMAMIVMIVMMAMMAMIVMIVMIVMMATHVPA